MKIFADRRAGVRSSRVLTDCPRCGYRRGQARILSVSQDSLRGLQSSYLQHCRQSENYLSFSLIIVLQKMLWWDDNCKRNANSEYFSWAVQVINLLFQDDKDSVECFRSSGVVKIPRKILRKSSAPPFNSRDKIPISRKTSCPPLKKGFEGEILCQLEITEDLRDQMEITPNYKIQEPFRRVRKVLWNKTIRNRGTQGRKTFVLSLESVSYLFRRLKW